MPKRGDEVEAGDNHRAGVVWLLVDMSLITIMSAIVKAAGGEYPAVQLVFIRAAIGLVLILPLICTDWPAIRKTKQLGRHGFRVLCNTIALTGNFAALAALPLALVTAVGFVRPLVTMLFAVLLLSERVGPRRWLGAAIGLGGVTIMIGPNALAWNMGLLAIILSVVFGSLATVQTRALKAESTTVLMIFYTLGLSLLTVIPAVATWHTVEAGDWLVLIAIGTLAQLGQFCFLRAYQSAPASVLAPFGYLSILFSTAAGYFVFNETPTIGLVVGACVVVAGVQMSR